MQAILQHIGLLGARVQHCIQRIVHSIGKFQRSRLGSALAFLVIDAVRPPLKRHGVKGIELSWILEDNAGMRSIIESIGGRAYKRYRVYERELDVR